MEDGSLRADANVSLVYLGTGHVPDHVAQSTARGVRCEIKNLNSVRHMTRAIDYEVTRQIEEMERGHVITKQTRFFDPVRKVTVLGRSKEDEKDYRCG
jgi:aspartyl-tRNA(Asn)/glutamyl-tRNA(Gln) amidotransferase subunit B